MPISKFRNIPLEMQQTRQWIVWRYEDRGSPKPTKVPYSVKGWHASVTEPTTWCTFEEACTAYLNAAGKLDGIGFVFTRNDKFCGIDLDATIDSKVVANQIKIFEKFDSYSEKSPSGKGLHIIIKADLLSGRRREFVEIYSSERFFTMTGDVFHNVPIAERQELASILWEEMGKSSKVQVYGGDLEEKYTDSEVINQALCAVNGDKFRTLLEGRWNDIYPSQSEADFAFVDIIAFYTQSRNQIARIFRVSPLGQRDKAQRSDYMQYMINKSFDRMLPPVDIEGLQNALDEAIARKRLEVASSVTPLPPIPASTNGRSPAFDAVNLGSSPKAGTNPPEDTEPSPYTIPQGLLGEMARFIYDAAPRQVPEIALAAAISFMAGVTGRAYNISGLGLNQYILLLAPTGTGKEVMASGIDKLVAAIKTEVPAVKEFIGPAEIASGQALLKYLSKTSCSFVSIVGEFGLKMQQLSARNINSADLMLKRVLLDLYNKSGNGRVIQPAIYSQRENNTDPVLAPAVTLLGESTPETFFACIDENVIADGLLPRFTLIEYTGKRPRLNKAHQGVKPSPYLVNKLKDLVAHCLKLNAGVNNTPLTINVKATEEAQLAIDSFDIYSDDMINENDSNTIKHLWNRAHVKLMKLAALIAVGVNPFDPVVTIEMVEWSRGLVSHDIKKLYARFDRGEFGRESEETKQQMEVKRMIFDYIMKPYISLATYAHSEQLHTNRIIPYAYINKRLTSMACFRLDKMGSTSAIKRSIASMIDAGYIREIGKNELATKYNTSQRAFMVSDMEWLIAK